MGGGFSGLDEGTCSGTGVTSASLTLGLVVSGIVDGGLLASGLGVRAGLKDIIPPWLRFWFFFWLFMIDSKQFIIFTYWDCWFSY